MKTPVTQEKTRRRHGRIGAQQSGPDSADTLPGPTTTEALEGGDRVSDSSNAKTSVYRYYDSLGVLLYVGITSRGVTRNREHNSTKTWWPFVTRQEVDHFDSRAEAIAAEKRLIRSFRPPFNKQHNPDYLDVQQAYLALASSTRAPIAQDVLKAYKKRFPLSVSDWSKDSTGRVTIWLKSYMDQHLLAPLLDAPSWPDGQRGIPTHGVGGGARTKIWVEERTILGVVTARQEPARRQATVTFKYVSQKPILIRATGVDFHEAATELWGK